MLYTLLERYFKKDNMPWYSPLAVAVITAGDYHLYLYESDTNWFVIVEAGYLHMDTIPGDIERSFPVKVIGWVPLLIYSEKSKKDLLLPDTFKQHSVTDSDEGWEYYHGVVSEDHGLKYVLLKVTPIEGVTPKNFGLEYYRDINEDEQKAA